MNTSPESTALAVLPDGTPGIMALSTPTKRADAAAFTRVENCLGHIGMPSSDERILAALMSVPDHEPEDALRKKAEAMANNHISGKPEGELVRYLMEYSGVVLDLAYAEDKAWNEAHPGWKPSPERAERRRLDPGVDALTQLLNRGGLDEKLDKLYSWCNEGVEEGKKRLVSFLLIDLDDFKNINDAHGHDSGDALLKIVAKRIRAHTRDSDLIIPSRPGGDEFVIVYASEVDMTENPEDMADWSEEDKNRLREILPEDQWGDKACLTVAQRAMRFASRLEEALDADMKSYAAEKWNEAGLLDKDIEKPDPGASIGVATGDPARERGATIRKRADDGMYMRKHARKLVKVLAAIDLARQELVTANAMPAMDEFIGKLEGVTSPLLKNILRKLREVRGDLKPAVGIR